MNHKTCLPHPSIALALLSWPLLHGLVAAEAKATGAEPLTFVYSQTEAGPLHLDLHPVAKPQAGETSPVLLWIHGGGWSAGGREHWKMVEWLTSEGIAVVSIDYRLVGKGVVFPAPIHDCKHALAWLGEHGAAHGLDISRIFVGGPSAGAHLASLLSTSGEALNPEDLQTKLPKIRGTLHYYGPADLHAMLRYAKKPEDALNQPQSKVYGLLGGPLNQKADLAKTASPATYWDAKDPPVLILVGTEDTLMTQRQCRNYHELIQAGGGDSTLHIIEGADHGGPPFQDAERRALILSWLRERM